MGWSPGEYLLCDELFVDEDLFYHGRVLDAERQHGRRRVLSKHLDDTRREGYHHVTRQLDFTTTSTRHTQLS